MKRLLVFFLSALSYHFAFSSPPIVNLPEETLSFGTLNPENLWDADEANTGNAWEKFKNTLSASDQQKIPPNSPQYDSYAPKYSNWYNKSVLNKKIKNFLETLEMMKFPDIIALQEIESAGNTSTVFEIPYNSTSTFREELAKLGYKYIYLGEQDLGNPVSVTTAFISKFELTVLPSIKVGEGSHSTSARDIQVVSLNLGEERIVFFNNHWKSKRGGNEEVRVATAIEVAKRVKEEEESEQKTHVVILGDFNSGYHEEPLEALGVCDGRPAAGSQEKYNLWFELDEKDRWENIFAGVKETLTGIVLSNSLLTKSGLHYEEGSFQVVGQKGPEKNKLLDVTGVPYRWQVKFFYSFSDHIGQGYSDHLPLVAKLSYKKGTQYKKRVKKISLPRKIYFQDIEPCDKTNSVDLLSFRGSVEELDRQCVKIFSEKKPLPLFRTGKFSKNYVHLPWIQSSTNTDLRLVLTMVGQYNWRPNIHDRRISYKEAVGTEDIYDNDHWHPRSNKCFTRKVLQGEGGRLAEVYGRAGYIEGDFSVSIASREDIVLTDLPAKKKKACLWDF